LADANRLGELEYCAAHPHPLLVHCRTTYQLRPVDKSGMTIDRVVLDRVVRPHSTPSGLDEYSAVPVRSRMGTRAFDLTVGCNPDCDIHIDDSSLSNLHARMTQDRHGNWYIQDASSLTGTHVNGKDPIETRPLVSGDLISFGMVDVTFLLPSQVYRLVRMLL
jgi:pSer/pThr/pTyr-binding forkhead associated (FHA) protein